LNRSRSIAISPIGRRQRCGRHPLALFREAAAIEAAGQRVVHGDPPQFGFGGGVPIGMVQGEGEPEQQRRIEQRDPGPGDRAGRDRLADPDLQRIPERQRGIGDQEQRAEQEDPPCERQRATQPADKDETREDDATGGHRHADRHMEDVERGHRRYTGTRPNSADRAA
jgi:hypothetical protein